MDEGVMNEIKQVCVVGAGAIGGIVAAYVARAGWQVSAIARGSHLAAVQKNGISIRSPKGDFTVAVDASDDAAKFGVQDLVVIGLKGQQIGAMLPHIAHLIGPQTIVLPAINGVPWWYFHKSGGEYEGSVIECLDPSRKMFAALDPNHIIGCVVHAAGEIVEPGVVRSNGNVAFYIGEPDNTDSARLKLLANWMTQSGLEPRVSMNIRVDMWTKLVGNTSFNPIAALTRAWMDDICNNEGLIALIRSVMQELHTVARAYGTEPSMTIDKRLDLARSVGRVKLSTLQDVEAGRALEIAPLLQAPLELGARLKLPMPWTQALCALTGQLNASLSGRT
jgi:2-dehydropantoate 2-reductase